MSHQSELISTDIESYLAEHEQKDLLRFLTCGSVDDGKSTLIGRLLHDSKMIYEDQLAAIEADSTTSGTTGDAPDLALLTDGLKAEREQGITIDVAYRYFSTARRKFIIADTPGHEQYTRNMVTGASTCDLAIILIDAQAGVLTQTKRHTTIANLLGIKHLVVAINKMDLVDWSQQRFDEICADYRKIAETIKTAEPYFLPISALAGDNVVEPSENMGWFEGDTLMQHLETVEVASEYETNKFRFPVQMVNRPNSEFRGFSGTIAAGVIKPGDPVISMPSGVASSVERIVTFDGDLEQAGAGRAVTLTLADEIDVSRGDMLVSPKHKPLSGHDIDAMLVWMAETPMELGKQYLIQSSSGVANASVSFIHYWLDINTLERESAQRLDLNDIAKCSITVDKELIFDPYRDNRVTGSFILIDRMSNATVAAGMIRGLGSSWDRLPTASLRRHQSGITPQEREARYSQKPCTVLLTGLSAAGKSTLATGLARRLFDLGKTVIRLDGENVRMGISRDLGFSAQERSENMRRVSEVAKLVNSQGLIAIAALSAPKTSVRQQSRELIGGDKYVEVFVDTPIEVCRERDPYGLYEAADRGEIPQFPGVSATYDRPEDMDLRVDTSKQSQEECVEAIIELLKDRGFLRD